jgi:hypothetical protein
MLLAGRHCSGLLAGHRCRAAQSRSRCRWLATLSLFATFVVASAVFATVCSLCHCLQSLPLFVVFATDAGPAFVAPHDVGAAFALLLGQLSLLRVLRNETGHRWAQLSLHKLSLGFTVELGLRNYEPRS